MSLGTMTKSLPSTRIAPATTLCHANMNDTVLSVTSNCVIDSRQDDVPPHHVAREQCIVNTSIHSASKVPTSSSCSPAIVIANRQPHTIAGTS